MGACPQAVSPLAPRHRPTRHEGRREETCGNVACADGSELERSRRCRPPVTRRPDATSRNLTGCP
jgi:hypothetical protein